MMSKINIQDKLLLFLIPFILVIIWFFHGNILGSGESGLPFYNFNTQLNILRWAWSEGGLGLNVGITSASKPTFIFFAAIEQLGLKGFLLQATLCYLLFVVSGFSTYYFVKNLFPNLPHKYFLLAALFYWFNPISIINVWNRFLYNYMFFWAQLPLLFLLIHQLLEKRKWLLVFLLNCTFIIFSYVQSSIPFILLSWLLIIFSFIFYFLTENNERRKFYIKALIVLIVLYILTNFWWITQLFSFLYSSNFTETTSLFFTTNGNLSGLTSLSQVLGMFSYTYRYFHSSFIESGPIWARIFSFNPLIIFEFFPSLIILWVIYKYRKIKEVIFLGLLFFLTLFLMKGNQPPFGEIFQFFFVKLPFIQVFRNPFEKFGFLLPLAAAPLFAFGVHNLVESTNKIILKRIYFLVPLLIVVLLWGFPFWTGLIFTSTNDTNVNILRKYEVSVPSYYKDANNWLNTQGDNFRFVSLPLGGEGMTYTWEKPYSGVELSSTLFDTPNISFNTSVPYYDKITSKIEKNLLQNNKFIDLLSFLNVKFLLLREDIDWRVRDMRNPQVIKSKLDQLFNNKKSFEALTIYSVPEATSGARIYASDRNVRVEPDMVIEDLLLFKDAKGGALYTNKEEPVLPNVESIIIKPNQISLYEKGKDLDIDTALSRLLYARYLPDSWFFPLINLKEKIDRNFSIKDPEERFIYDVTHLGKRVVEVYKLIEKKSNQSYIDKSIDSYIKNLLFLIKEYPERFKDEPSNTSKLLIKEEFYKHLIVLNNARVKLLNSNTSKIEEAITMLKKDMVDFGYVTLYPILIDSLNNKYWIYYFNVPKSGKYSLYFDNNQINAFYNQTNNLKFQIDNSVLDKSLIFENNLINLGETFLTEGIHEIGIPEPENIDLVQADKEIVLNSKTQPQISLSVSPFDPFSNYVVSYDYWIKKGGVFHLTVSNDNDIKNSPNNNYNYRKTVSEDKYVHDFIHDQVYISPKNGSSKLNIGFVVDSYNDCYKDNDIFLKDCLNKKVKNQFDKETEVVIRNLTVNKIFNNKLYLYQPESDIKTQIPNIKFSKLNPSEYKINVQSAKEPYLLVFSELFHQGWKIKIKDGNFVEDKNHLLVNAYANGWLINKLGDYEMTLKFAPQNLMDKGEKISLVSSVITLLLAVFFLKKKI